MLSSLYTTSSISMSKQFRSLEWKTVYTSALLLIQSLHQLTGLSYLFLLQCIKLKESKVFNEVIDLDRRLLWLSIPSLPEPAVGGILTIHHLTYFLFVGLLSCEYLDLEN